MNINELFGELSDDDKADVLSATVDYMQNLITVFGTESGTEIWNAVTGALGDELKHSVTMSLLTDGISSSVSLRLVDVPKGQAVPCIKAIRQATGMGLKEAKDVYDYVVGNSVFGQGPNRGPTPQVIKCTNRYAREELRVALRSMGATYR